MRPAEAPEADTLLTLSGLLGLIGQFDKMLRFEAYAFLNKAEQVDLLRQGQKTLFEVKLNSEQKSIFIHRPVLCAAGTNGV